MSNDGYPPFTQDDLGWFRGLLVEIAEDETHVEEVGRRRAGLDLEIVFEIALKSRHLFTERVCLSLTEKVKKRTGVAGPVVYELNQPHAQAQEAIDYAARG